MPLMRMLLVEDDRDLSEFVREGMAREGFAVDVARDGEDALHQSTTNDYEVILLDVNLPKLDGISILKTLRSQGKKTAILLVTCKGQEKDKLEGLYSGADDYLVKPFLLSELVARVRTVLRRTVGAVASEKGAVLKVGVLSLDLLKRHAKRSGKDLALTKAQFDLLECFMRRPGQVISQNVLRQHLAGVDFDGSTNAIEVHISHLRAKIDKKGELSLIRTARGSGYALDA